MEFQINRNFDEKFASLATLWKTMLVAFFTIYKIGLSYCLCLMQYRNFILKECDSVHFNAFCTLWLESMSPYSFRANWNEWDSTPLLLLKK